MIYIGWFVRIWHSSEETGSYRQEEEEGEEERKKWVEEQKEAKKKGRQRRILEEKEREKKKKNKKMLSESRESDARGGIGAKQEYLLMEEEQKANLYIAGQSQANLPRGSFKFSLWSCFCMRNVQVYLLEMTCCFWLCVTFFFFYGCAIKGCLAMH